MSIPRFNASLIGIVLLLFGQYAVGSEEHSADLAYQDLEGRLKRGKTANLKKLRKAFLSVSDMPNRFQISELIGRSIRMQGPFNENQDTLPENPSQTLETEIFQIEKLLESNYGNLTGHLLAYNYYSAQNQADATNHHGRVINAIVRLLESSGKGKSLDDAITILTPSEAYAYVKNKGFPSFGGTYLSSASDALHLALLIKPAKVGGHETIYFDLSELWRAFQKHSSQAKESEQNNSGPGGLILQLARAGDDAAQTTIGLSAKQRSGKAQEGAEFWLKEAHKKGNLQATLFLADLYQSLAQATQGKEVRFLLDQAALFYLKAIAKNSTQAMLNLALLYLSDNFSGNYKALGLSLLYKASQLGDVSAMLVLAEIRSKDFYLETPTGREHISPSLQQSARLLRQAGELGDEYARLAYARLLVNQNKEVEFSHQALVWLKLIARSHKEKNDNSRDSLIAEAMILLGWANAKGLAKRPNFRLAKQWWEQAAREVASAQVINEVAYIFAVIDEPRLRSAKKSLALMDEMMRANPSATKNYAYLDTWASAYAANSQFQQAIDIQKMAIDQAKQSDRAKRNGELELLESHLKAFQKSQIIYDIRLD